MDLVSAAIITIINQGFPKVDHFEPYVCVKIPHCTKMGHGGVAILVIKCDIPMFITQLKPDITIALQGIVLYFDAM